MDYKIDRDGIESWYDDDGQFHRENGPARIWLDGHKVWYKHGDRHREDGPAIEHHNGDKLWYLNGKCHREDGPACERANGDKLWYLNGERLDCHSQEEFETLLKLKAFW